MTTRFETLERTVSIPDHVSVQVEGRTVKVKGPLGSLQEDLSHLPVSINVNENRCDWKRPGRGKERLECWGLQRLMCETCSKESRRATGTSCEPSTPTFQSRSRWMRRRRC